MSKETETMGNIVDLSIGKSLKNIKSTVDQIADWVIITDLSGTIVYANPEVESLSGYNQADLIGQKASVFKSDLVSESVYEELWETILSGESYLGVMTNRHKNGNLYYIAVTISPIKNEAGDANYFIAVGKNIDKCCKLNEQIHNTIHYDALTGLFNRNSFVEEVSQAKQSGINLAVIAININKLGLINSKYGFLCGDQVIKEVGLRIKKTIYPDCTLSRLEGKVFGILFPNFKELSSIVQLIHEIEDAVKMAIQLKEEEFYVSLSFGIATYNKNKNKVITDTDIGTDVLLTRAQLALSQAKQSNSMESYAFYTFTMNEQANKVISIGNEIYTACRNDEFVSYFQPLIDLNTGKVSGLEALMRRRKPNGEIVAPGQFIGALEESGLIIPVGFSLIRKICVQIRNWIDQYGFSVPVSINLSPVQFNDEYFCEKLTQIIEEEGVSPSLITFEIIESMLIEDVNRTVCILEQLRAYGFETALDDFGTGYSSLSYIQKFKINSIKIDMSFIRKIVTSEADQAIVKAIIMMAKALNLYTVAEGIETKEQLDIIRELGCDVGQGYYWDRPLAAEQILLKY